MLALALTAAGCAGDGGDSGPGRATVSLSTAVVAVPSTIPPASTVPDLFGPTRVGPDTFLPTVDIDWTSHELEPPTGAFSDVWLSHVSVDEAGTLTAIAFSWDARTDRQTVITWTSEDGDPWTRSDVGLESGTAMHQAVAVDDVVIGLGQRISPAGTEALVWAMDDGGGWDRVDFSRSDLDLSGVTALHVASNATGIVIGAERDLDAPRPPISFETEGFRFELDDLRGTYELVDLASGRVVAAGESADLFRWSDQGQAVYDIATGELLTTVPWEVWETTGPPVSPLPIPALDRDVEQPVVVVWDGFEITMDQINDRFNVVEVETSAPVTSGSLNDLFRGPAPMFIDSESDETILTFTWERWDALMNSAYQRAIGVGGERHAEQLALFSTDGRRWTEVSLTNDVDRQFDSLVATGDEFVAVVVGHGDFESTRSLLASTNGIDWVQVDQQPFTPIVPVGSDERGVIGLTYEAESSTLMASSDGRSWTPELEMATQDDGGAAWLQFAATGGAGRVAIATVDPAPHDAVLEITVGTRTATFGLPGSVVEITDAVTGETLRNISFEDVENGDSRSVTYADEATTFWSSDGSPLMTISDAEAFAAFEAQALAFEDAVRRVVFVENEGQWFESELPDLEGGFPVQLAVGVDVIVVAAMSSGDWDSEGTVSPGVYILVGRIP